MKKYYYNCPRGFSNEFDVISVEQTNPVEVAAMEKFYNAYLNSSNVNWDLRQITAKRAEEITRAERQTARMYCRCGMNLSNNPVGATEITTATEFFRY